MSGEQPARENRRFRVTDARGTVHTIDAEEFWTNVNCDVIRFKRNDQTIAIFRDFTAMHLQE